MGYACPVCDDPQADAGHLANHLAFTAMLGDAAHESWLEDNVPDWTDHDEESLADAVTDYAAETEYPQVFEDTVDRQSTGETGSDGVADHEGEDERSGALFEDASEPESGFAAQARRRATRELDDDTTEVLEEAREMTRAMLDDGADNDPGRDASDDTASDEAETE